MTMIETEKDTTRKLPDGWRWVRLGEVCEFQYGSGLIQEVRQEGNIPVYGSNGIVGYHAAALTSGPTIIIGRKGSIGQVHFSSAPCFPIDTTYFVDRVKLPVHLAWLSYILQTLGLPVLNKASGVPGLNRNDAYKLGIPLPPLDEQRRIARVLREQMATVEKARGAAQARLEAVNALPAAFLRQVFPQPGQPLPSGWRWVRLGEVCEVVGGSTPDTSNLDYWEGEIVWVTPTDLGKLSDIRITSTARRITPAGLRSCSTEMLPIGTIIMSSRAPIGHLAIADVSLCTNQGCKSFVPSPDIDSGFLYWLLKQAVPDIRALGSGATFAEVSKSALQQFAIPLPPLSDQQRIAAVLREQMTAVEKVRAAVEEELNTINSLPVALLRRAFSGEL